MKPAIAIIATLLVVEGLLVLVSWDEGMDRWRAFAYLNAAIGAAAVFAGVVLGLIALWSWAAS